MNFDDMFPCVSVIKNDEKRIMLKCKVWPELSQITGWIEKDIPNIRPRVWDFIMDTIGEGEVIILTNTVTLPRDEPDEFNPDHVQWIRGYIMISDKGRDNLANLAKVATEEKLDLVIAEAEAKFVTIN